MSTTTVHDPWAFCADDGDMLFYDGELLLGLTVTIEPPAPPALPSATIRGWPTYPEEAKGNRAREIDLAVAIVIACTATEWER